MSRRSNTDARRAQIVRALIAIMAKQGYDGASIGDIAKRAGLTAGLVHYHFKNKLEILRAAVRVLDADHAAVLDAAIVATPDPHAQLIAYIEVHLGLGAHANPEALACWILVGAEAIRERHIRGEVEATLVGLTDRLVDIIERGQAAKQFARVDAKAAAAALIATIQGYFMVAATARTILPAGTAAASTLRMAEGLLQPTRPLRTTRARR